MFNYREIFHLNRVLKKLQVCHRFARLVSSGGLTGVGEEISVFEYKNRDRPRRSPEQVSLPEPAPHEVRGSLAMTSLSFFNGLFSANSKKFCPI
jgi:hypothetical protein